MKISIITANYNYSIYLNQLFDSIINQDYENWEHIIVDDGSTDISVKIINDYVQSDLRIKLIKQNNQGQTKALNNALRNITGDIICWINSDDWFFPGAFSKIVNKFQENPNADIVYGDAIVYYENSSLVKKRKQLFFDFDLFLYNGFSNCLFSNSAFWKKKKQDEVGLLNDKYKYNMDGEFFPRLFLNSGIKKINYPIAYFRAHDKSKTIQNIGKKMSDEYINEINVALISSLRLKGLNDDIHSINFKTKKLYFKIIRIFLRFIYGHYFHFKKLIEQK